MTEVRDPPRSRRILRVIALERFVRGVVLIVAGAYLLTHLGSDLGRIADRLGRALELDTHRPFLRHLIEKLHRLRVSTVVITGIAALGYGLLESVEGVGLWLDKLWAEYLTVIATSLSFPSSSTSWPGSRRSSRRLGIAVNVAIVIYLARALRRRVNSHGALVALRVSNVKELLLADARGCSSRRRTGTAIRRC